MIESVNQSSKDQGPICRSGLGLTFRFKTPFPYSLKKMKQEHLDNRLQNDIEALIKRIGS